jgi:hypothetical protein
LIIKIENLVMVFIGFRKSIPELPNVSTLVSLFTSVMGLFSFFILMKVEEELKKTQVALDECEAKLIEALVEETPVVVEKSWGYFDYGVLAAIGVSLCLTLFVLVTMNRYAPSGNTPTFSTKGEVVAEIVRPSSMPAIPEGGEVPPLTFEAIANSITPEGVVSVIENLPPL